MRYEKEYFEKVKYSQRGQLVTKHVEEVLKWASKTSHINLLKGRGKTALDVGCAYGYGVAVLSDFGYETCGVDISRHSLGQANRRISGVDFVVCDGQNGLPFVGESFDLVICFEVLEHLANPLTAITSMLRSCRGFLLCTSPNRAVEKPVKKIVRDFDETHIGVRTPREWKRDLSKMAESDNVWVESFLDSTLRISDRMLFYRSFRIPYFGLDTRILVKRRAEAER